MPRGRSNLGARRTARQRGSADAVGCHGWQFWAQFGLERFHEFKAEFSGRQKVLVLALSFSAEVKEG